MKQGETFLRAYRLANDDGSPISLAGWVLRSSVSKGATTVSLTVTVLDSPNGEFQVSAVPTVTLVWAKGEWRHDVRLEDSLGVVVYSETKTFGVEEAITP